MEPVGEVVPSATLDPSALAEVTALLDRAERADGAPPLNETGRLSLDGAPVGVTHVRVLRDGATVGYAQLEHPPADAGPERVATGQVVVDPPARRTGVGTALVDALVQRATAPLRVWAVGDTAAAAGLARRTGLTPVRTLLIMTRDLDQVADPVVPDGIEIDTFDPATDGPRWLAVNRRAFAHHPEQGSLTSDDLALRTRQPWFDPAGFFVARSVADPDGPLLGFHWTKRHGDGLGEVYVIGVDPEAEGRGLAKALLLTGLEHLREAGDRTVELYVEADSARAVGLYESRGFTVTSRDVMYGEVATGGR